MKKNSYNPWLNGKPRWLCNAFRVVSAGLVLTLVSSQNSYANDMNVGVNPDDLLVQEVPPTSQQKEIKITGKVVDKQGEAIPGVNVYEKGNVTNGVISGIDGTFSLSVDSPKDVIIFSFIGYMDQEILVSGKKQLNVTLVEDAIGLEEVVAIGYGSKTKGTLTGSTYTVDEKIFSSRPQTEPINSLQGEIPGLKVVRGGGRIGKEGSSLEIRGVTSRSNPGVLIVIDGIPQREADANALNSLNPQDIESVTTLKDAQAAIYGARAAGGVILVTTKKGKTGKPRISYDANFSWNVPGPTPEITDVRQHMLMASEAFENDGNKNHFFVKAKEAVTDPNFDISQGKIIPGPFGDTPTLWLGHNNWMDTMWGTAFMQTHNLSVSGKSENSNYFISAGVLDQGSMLNFGDNSNLKYFTRMKYDFQAIENLLHLGVNLSLQRQKIVEPYNYGHITALVGNVWSSMPTQTPEGNYYNFGGFQPPHAYAESGGSTELMKYRTKLQFNAKLTPFEGFSLNSNFVAPCKSVRWGHILAYQIY